MIEVSAPPPRRGRAGGPWYPIPMSARQRGDTLAVIPQLPYKSSQTIWPIATPQRHQRQEADTPQEEIMSAAEVAGVVDLDRDALLGMYERMVEIRVFEDLAGKNFAAGLIPG